MVSQRHKGAIDVDLLDVARECVIDLGWKRTTITEVARRAGVSRMTIYRKWPDMDRLGAELMLREWHEVFGSLGVSGSNPREELVETLVAGVKAMASNEIFRRIVTLDPEVLLPYVFVRRSRTHAEILEMTAAAIRDGQAAGDIRPGDPTAMARALALITQSFIFSAATMVDADVSADALENELRITLTRSLTP